MKKKVKNKILMLAAIITIIAIGLIWNVQEKKHVEASVSKEETINLRIIGTTDIHGQLSGMDYDKGVQTNNRGLARAYDLIQKARAELPKENTLTFDAGDFLFDYTTEYIFSENQNEIQPIVHGMAMIGYDAITLGNHEFDYGYEYLLRQLNGSGLRNITVVSNVWDSKTGEYPFLENMMITRSMKTNTGKKVQVKVGIIGQTIPTLTGKTHSYAGILVTEDIVENTKKQAIKLKEMGADIVVVIAHTGIGPVNPELNYKNVAYALTKIPEVDVILCGHEHNAYPTTDLTSPYYRLPGVDKNTYLINGKNVIMPTDRGRAIGVVDLTLKVSDNSVQINDRKSELRYVSETNTKEDKNIAALVGKWEEKLLRYSNDVIGVLDKGVVIQNYYGLLGDNTAIQILNDSKIHYALKFANTTGQQYRDYPIIAASSYASYGITSIEDFINIHDQITESHLATIQPYNNYLHVYTITGKQLKEWLEWSASAYETTSTNTVWSNATMSSLMKEKKLKSLIREEWLDDWSSFFIFDGIDYEINPFAHPRYDISGNRISNNTRVHKITYNGKPVTDDMVLLLSTNKITKPTDANRGVETQVVLKGFVRSQTILSKFISEVAKSGSILPQVDNNWRVNFADSYRFIVKAPYYANDLIMRTRWYVDYLLEKDEYRYYIASYPKNNGDTIAPHIIVAPTKTGITRSAYEVAVNVSDASEIKSVKFLKGDYDVDYHGWAVARNVTRSTFTVIENGIYTVYAEDIHGNKAIKRVTIDNFSTKLLGSPTVVSYTNRKTRISGKAEPNKRLVFEAYTGTYETKVPATGNYSYALPSQPSGSIVTVYIKDEQSGMESEHVTVTVRRTGPNQPSINPVYNNAGYITGNINDDDATVVAIIDNYVYVSDKGGKERYEKAADIYERGLNIVETQIEVYESGHYIIVLPVQEAGKKITIYNLDHLSRISRVNSVTVQDVAPNAPIVYEVSNIERSITGYVPTKKAINYDIYISLAGKYYRTKTDKNGKFTFSFDQQLRAGQVIDVYATDTVNGTERVSYNTKVIVDDIQSFVDLESETLTLNPVNSKSNIITGNYMEKGNVMLAITTGEGETFTSSLYTVQPNNSSNFLFELNNQLTPGTKIYVMTRFTEGIILNANMTEVIPGIPDAPKLLMPIANSDKSVQVISDKDCEVVLKIGKKTYRSRVYQLDEVQNQYIYTFTIDRNVSGTNISIMSTNVSGTSTAFTSKIVKAAPDSPQVKSIKAGNKKITGKIELLDYITPSIFDEQNPMEETIPDSFNNAEPMVAKTQTRVFAQIGNKTYEGKIDNKGNFEIAIPAQKEGTAIKLWGTNKAGRGPLVKIVVAK